MIGLQKSTKSKMILTLLKRYPNIMTKSAVKSLITDPQKAIFSYEDGAEALQLAREDEQTIIEETPVVDHEETASSPEEGKGKADKVHLKNSADIVNDRLIYPNVKLEMELNAACDIERNKFTDFSDAWNKLNETTKDIDDMYGDHVSQLLDELKLIDGVDSSEIDKIKDMDVTLETINSEVNAQK